ncbi:non-hydrolyzing UDP-N-acetylglucosamine 2-epimerase [Thermodesulfovibrio hydrogeniphilus]
MSRKRILCVFGTRPEAIKMAPVIMELKKHEDLETVVCVTAQHREMLDQVLKIFCITPDIDLDLMKPSQTLAEVTANVVQSMDNIFKTEKFDLTLIQGDTTTVMATSLAAFYNSVKVGHVEAGLRSHNILSPFPEELNRRITALVTQFHFAPTTNARDALLKEGIPEEKIFVTGNTVIDALFYILKKPMPTKAEEILRRLGRNKKIILVTAHRRENFGKRLESICLGLRILVERNKDITIIYPVHLNPNVREPVFKILKNLERVILLEPVEYDVLIHLMNASYLVLTDSGGIQEEAPSLGKPVLVMRTETERPEGIHAGTAKLVGPYEERIVEETENLLYNREEYEKMAKAVNPYGDGKASQRIVEIIRKN